MVKTNLTKNYPSSVTIKINQFVRYVKVGKCLHFIALLGILIFVIGFQNTTQAFNTPFEIQTFIWLYITMNGFTLPIFAEIDAYGRYQNYKQIKDRLYNYGYDNRLVKPFIFSKCQRDAVLVASSDLLYQNKVKEYFYNKGYRWFHIFPDNFVKNPLVLIKKTFGLKFYLLKNINYKTFIGNAINTS